MVMDVLTLCKCDLFVLSWARVHLERRVSRRVFVSLVHYVTVFNAAFGMTCSSLMLVEDERGNHLEDAISRAL